MLLTSLAAVWVEQSLVWNPRRAVGSVGLVNTPWEFIWYIRDQDVPVVVELYSASIRPHWSGLIFSSTMALLFSAGLPGGTP